MSGGYEDERNRVDEWAYCASRRMGVAALGAVLAAASLAALGAAAAVVYAFWGWAL